MNVRVLYAADETTTEMIIEGDRLTSQVYVDGRGMVTVYDGDNKLIRRITFAKVHLIDLMFL